MMRMPMLTGKMARRTASAAVIGLAPLLASHIDQTSECRCFGSRMAADIRAANEPVAGPAGEHSAARWRRLSDYRLPGTKRASKRRTGKGSE
jgi:hypothetical protein